MLRLMKLVELHDVHSLHVYDDDDGGGGGDDASDCGFELVPLLQLVTYYSYVIVFEKMNR